MHINQPRQWTDLDRDVGLFQSSITAREIVNRARNKGLDVRFFGDCATSSGPYATIEREISEVEFYERLVELPEFYVYRDSVFNNGTSGVRLRAEWQN